ncbi:MAG: hypothetical protein HY725_09620 [Candidatus Rokubacteria bacterium]|nr:hypothetical protein [Candidatus Rokubacteria bacterium]
MRYMGMLKALAISAALVLPVVACAAGKDEKPAASGGSQVTVVGTNYCLGCALKKEHGAAAQCSKYGHRHSLKVEKAVDGSGKELAALRGRTLSYLDNEKSEQLVKGEVFHKERVEVKGRLYEAESVIEVVEIKSP